MGESFVHLQMVVVSEPRLVAELLHSGDLAKPSQPVMVHFRQVRPWLQLCYACLQAAAKQAPFRVHAPNAAALRSLFCNCLAELCSS